jgi:hypothetical protein
MNRQRAERTPEPSQGWLSIKYKTPAPMRNRIEPQVSIIVANRLQFGTGGK